MKRSFTQIVFLLCLLAIIFCFPFRTLLAQPPDVEWTKTFGGTKHEVFWNFTQNSAGDYLLCGSSKSFGGINSDLFLVKTNFKGEEIWYRTYGGNRGEYGDDVKQTSDGGYIIVGGTQSYGAGKYDVYLNKIDANGDKTWGKTYGGPEADGG